MINCIKNNCGTFVSPLRGRSAVLGAATLVARPGARNALCVADQGRRNPLLSRTIGYYSVCHCTLAFFPFFYFEEIKERISQGCEGFSPRNLRRLRWFLRKVKLYHSLSSFTTARSRGVSPKLGFFILSFCRSVKESIKESASERRQEFPAGTGAAPLCQPLKCGADYRDVTAALKMKHLRRFRGERLTFLAVAVIFRQSRRREEG